MADKVVESALFSPLLLCSFDTVLFFDSGNLDRNVLLYFFKTVMKTLLLHENGEGVTDLELGPSSGLSFRELIVGFLEMETPASASSPSSQLSADLKDVWPHRLRPVLTPVMLFSAPVRAALVGFKMNRIKVL